MWVYADNDNNNNPDYSIVENGQNIEKSPGDLTRLAVTHSSERPSANADVKNSNEWIIIIIMIIMIITIWIEEKVKCVLWLSQLKFVSVILRSFRINYIKDAQYSNHISNWIKNFPETSSANDKPHFGRLTVCKESVASIELSFFFYMKRLQWICSWQWMYSLHNGYCHRKWTGQLEYKPGWSCLYFT